MTVPNAMQRHVFQPQTAVYGRIIRFEILHRQQRGLGIYNIWTMSGGFPA